MYVAVLTGVPGGPLGVVALVALGAGRAARGRGRGRRGARAAAHERGRHRHLLHYQLHLDTRDSGT